MAETGSLVKCLGLGKKPAGITGAVNLPGPQGPAGAREASLTSCREKGFDATLLLGTTVN